ncbi:hypothetical protein FS837_004945 [Tulasnella sp. UAMH 9824]|nr:hypothetical protein FS837_004945 [Tulasnella sp. UAMH 9824]
MFIRQLRTPLRSFSRASAASTGTQLAALAYRRYLSDEARSIIDKAVKAQPLYVNGEFIGGCDIVMSMHQNGELEALFTKEKVVEPAAEADASSAKPVSS